MTPNQMSKLTGLHVSKIHERLRAGRVPGAQYIGQRPGGFWAIPNTSEALAACQSRGRGKRGPDKQPRKIKLQKRKNFSKSEK